MFKAFTDDPNNTDHTPTRFPGLYQAIRDIADLPGGSVIREADRRLVAFVDHTGAVKAADNANLFDREIIAEFTPEFVATVAAVKAVEAGRAASFAEALTA